MHSNSPNAHEIADEKSVTIKLNNKIILRIQKLVLLHGDVIAGK